MRKQQLMLTLLITFCIAAVHGQTPAARMTAASSNPAAVVGVWRAEADGLPAVTVVISDESGSLSGAILFYFHMREASGKPYTSEPGLPEPIFNLKFDGDALTFQVSHRRAHPPRTLSDPPITMQLKLIGRSATGQMQGELSNMSERSPTVIAIKSDY